MSRDIMKALNDQQKLQNDIKFLNNEINQLKLDKQAYDSKQNND